MVVNIDKTQHIVVDFIDSQLIPKAPSLVKFGLVMGSYLAVKQADRMVQENLPLLKGLGLVNENNQYDVDVIKESMDHAFSQMSSFNVLYGFTITKQDGDNLIKIMERYKDE